MDDQRHVPDLHRQHSKDRKLSQIRKETVFAALEQREGGRRKSACLKLRPQPAALYVFIKQTCVKEARGKFAPTFELGQPI
jgi:hypothetical protein